MSWPILIKFLNYKFIKICIGEVKWLKMDGKPRYEKENKKEY